MTLGRFASEMIESVERGRAVALGEGGVIEDILHEKVDSALIGQDGLADVNQFGRPWTDNMDTQQLPCVTMKHELEQSFKVAADVSARDFPIEGSTDAVRDPGVDELFFGLSDRRDFRDGVDAIREHLRCGWLDHPTRMAGGEPSLLHRGGRQSRKSDDISDRIYMRDGCLEVLVDRQLSLVGFEANRFEIQRLSVPAATHRVEHHVGRDGLLALQSGHDASSRVEDDVRDFLSQAHNHAVTPHVGIEYAHDLLIDKPEQVGPSIDQGNLDTKGRQHRGVLRSDDAPTHDRHAGRMLFGVQNRIGITDGDVVERNGSRSARA